MTLRALLATLLLFCLGALGAAETRPLGAALDDLRTSGINLIYSSALVRDDMTVPVAPALTRESLNTALAPHGLRALELPGGRVVITKVPPPVGIVSFVKIVSDKVPDVSSLDAWQHAYLKDGMTPREKALKIWESVVGHVHQDSPPNEYLDTEGVPQDPIKAFNVYGYGFASMHAGMMLALARHAGFNARSWALNIDCVAELEWGGRWHMLDASLINWFPNPDGDPASVDDLMRAVKDWYDRHPEFFGNGEKLYHFGRNGGWRKGPALLAAGNNYDENGWLPAGTHGWSNTMQHYDGRNPLAEGNSGFVYEYPYTTGYQVNIQLRKGEKLTRNWSNKGLHVNMLDGGAPGALKTPIGQEFLRYAPKFGDIAPGRVGNGVLEYEVPLASGEFRGGALTAENLACTSDDGQKPALHPKDAAKNATLVLRMPSSYVYLTGTLDLDVAAGKGAQVRVAYSDNNGLDWTELARLDTPGAHALKLDQYLLRRYDYRLKLTLMGGAGLNRVHLIHDVQHSQRPLPAFEKGDNTLHFSAGPAEGTITVEGATSLEQRARQLTYLDFHPVVENMGPPNLFIQGWNKSGSLAMPIETPADMERLRVSLAYRVRDAQDGLDVQLSTDDGISWKTVARAAGPQVSHHLAWTFGDLPPGTRKAWVRFAGNTHNATGIFNLRIDADYKEPRGGFRPIKITYKWEEAGQPKEQVLIAHKPDETFTVHCVEKPLMKSIAMEFAD